MIAGFNTSNPEMKKYDMERLGKIVGNLLCLVAGFLVVLGLYSVQEKLVVYSGPIKILVEFKLLP